LLILVEWLSDSSILDIVIAIGVSFRTSLKISSENGDNYRYFFNIQK